MTDAPTGEPARGRDVIEPSDLRELLERARSLLSARREHIDALNVFPVPDGDTGTNLLLTVRSALDESAEDGHRPDTLARGALVGARGNSGVILSQVVRAFADTVEERGVLDAEGVGAALVRARDNAYDAVANPVEGTMLTAIRMAAERASTAGLPDIRAVAEAVLEEVREAVRRSTDELDVLREAGVVDAGAVGFQAFCEALLGLVRGDEVPVAEEDPAPIVRRDGPVAAREAGSLEFRFEVQYVLTAGDDAVAPLRERLGQLGDSVVISSMGGLLNVHVHTNDVGAAIEAGLAHGRPSRIQVTSFADQIDDRRHGEQAGTPGGGDETSELACVCVLPEGALHDLARQLGCAVVPGAAGSLPSVAELLNAIAPVAGAEVVVLPGHPNVVPTAEQAARVSEAEGGRPIHVVGTADSVPRIVAALALWDPDGDVDAVIGRLSDAASATASGEIVPAQRDAGTPLGRIRRGQMLAVLDGEVIAARDAPIDALRELARASATDGAEIVTLIVGGDVDDDERDRAVTAIEEVATGAEVQVIDGQQRPVRYFLGVE